MKPGTELTHASGVPVEVVRVLSPNMIEVRAANGSIHFVGRDELEDNGPLGNAGARDMRDDEHDTEPAPPPTEEDQ